MRVRVPATECERIRKEELEEERRRKTDRVFRQEYLCEFGDAEASVFSEDSISYQLSAISCQLSAISYQRSAAGFA
jgi:hypothetical protein